VLSVSRQAIVSQSSSVSRYQPAAISQPLSAGPAWRLAEPLRRCPQHADGWLGVRAKRALALLAAMSVCGICCGARAAARRHGSSDARSSGCAVERPWLKWAAT